MTTVKRRRAGSNSSSDFVEPEVPFDWRLAEQFEDAWARAHERATGDDRLIARELEILAVAAGSRDAPLLRRLIRGGTVAPIAVVVARTEDDVGAAVARLIYSMAPDLDEAFNLHELVARQR